MIDLADAKKLRDAGFEVPLIGEQFFRDRKTKVLKQSAAVNVVTDPKTDEDIEVPTLEDLIEFVDGKDMIKMYETLYSSLALRKLLVDKGRNSV